MNVLSHAFLARTRSAFAALAGLAMLTACGGGLDPVLGSSGVGIAPTVMTTAPAATTPPVTNVPTNTRVTATFSKAMNAATLTTASVTVACGGIATAGSVIYDNQVGFADDADPTTALGGGSIQINRR